ncbi:MAG TPA: FAD binding domain-containing protein [Dongiaceae bacterium]|jgi:CO/xanthine dehydrogenase FAD-binding subunit|nr:FAD binding domain-containing protein [Dongiaceae bacterium]
MGAYLRPDRLADALTALSRSPFAVIAGGTDFYPARVERIEDEDVLDISGLGELRRIKAMPRYLRIGAGVTWSDLLRAELPRGFDGLKLAAREVGGIQIQNTGTIVGNICNASPAADGLPNLLALDAEVELASLDGQRRLPIGEFVTGNRRTLRRPEELVTALLIPNLGGDARSDFLKLGGRKYLVISIVMVAAVLELAGKRIERARIAVGACSEIARRLPALEAALAGQPLDVLGQVVKPEHIAGLSPIDDLRASGAYRRKAALVLLRRSLNRLGAAA